MKLSNKIKKEVKEFSKEIKRVYVLLDWEWHSVGFPTSASIESNLLRFIEGVYKEEYKDITSGGLYARRDYYDKDTWGVEYGFNSSNLLPPKNEL